MKVGEALKEIRLAAGLTQTEMAAGFVSESFYSKVERGVHNIDADTLIKILVANHIHPVNFYSFVLREPIQDPQHKKNTYDSSVIIKKIVASAYKRDLVELAQLKKQVDKAEEEGKPYYIWVYYALELMTAWITHSTDNLSEPVKKMIYRLSSRDNWGMLNYEFLGIAFIALTPDQVLTLSHAAYRSYEKKTENALNSDCITGICDLAVDFLMYAYIHNFNKELCSETFEFFDKNIPHVAQFYQFRIIIKLYKALFANDTKKIELYTNLLKEDDLTFCLQHIPLNREGSSNAD